MMSKKYGKFSAPTAQQLAEAQDTVGRETKQRLEQLDSGRAEKKSRHTAPPEEEPVFYDDEEEERGEAQYEAFHAIWKELEERVATRDERLESDWAALKKRIAALVAERRALPAPPSLPAPQSAEALALEVERDRFNAERDRLMELQAATALRDHDAEDAQLETYKEACRVRFNALYHAPQSLRAQRDSLCEQRSRALSNTEMRALTAPLDLTALFASLLAARQDVYYGAARDYVVLVVAGGASFIMVRRDALLLSFIQ
jgi:hypothetical protein